MGLALAVMGLFALFVLITLIAGIKTLFSPKEKRGEDFSSHLISVLKIAIVMAIIDFLIFHTTYKNGDEVMPLYGGFLITFFQGLIFGRILIEIILANAVMAIIQAIRIRVGRATS